MCKCFTLLRDSANIPAFADQLCCLHWLALAKLGVWQGVFCLNPRRGLQIGSMLYCIIIACITHATVFAQRSDCQSFSSLTTGALTNSCTMTYLSRSVCQQPCLQTADSNNLLCGSLHLLDAAVCSYRYSTKTFCRARSALTSKSVWSRCSSKFERLGAQRN